MNDTAIQDGFRSICAMIDKGVYWILSNTFDLATDLSKINIFKDSAISEFSLKIYALIGIFMIFKITFSFITYIINPNMLSDKSKGGITLLKHIIITLLLIVIMPTAFSLLTEAQNAILEDQVLEKFILGDSQSNQGMFIVDEKCITHGGKNPIAINTIPKGEYISLLVFRTFYQMEEVGTSAGGDTLNQSELEEFAKEDNYYCDARSVNDLLRSSIVLAPSLNSPGRSSGIYRVNYRYIISTIVGIAVSLIMVSFCMDIAFRSIKLFFLEIISPVPIMSYISPTQGKGGILSKWASELMKTWLDLFLRLGSIYLCVYIISLIDYSSFSNSNVNSTGVFSLLVPIFMIIGALIFAKKIPELIQNIFGIKMSGTFNINPIKKFESEALFGKQITSGIKKGTAMAVGGTTALASNMAANRARRLKLQEAEEKYDRARTNAAEIRMKHNESIQYGRALASKAAELRQKIASEPNTSKREELNRELDEVRTQIRNGHTESARLKEQLSSRETAEAASKENLDKVQSSLDTFSFKHQGITDAIQFLSGAYNAAGSNPKGIIDAITKGYDAAVKAAAGRNTRDKIPLEQRMDDIRTDLLGVKNESGTTSEISKKIKQQNEKLTDISNALNALSYQLGNLPTGSVTYGADGMPKANEAMLTGRELEAVNTLTEAYKDLRNSQKATTKEVKEYQDILDAKKKK